MSKVKTPVLLVIMDGWGLTAPGPGNAISQAHMQTVEGWKRDYPWVAAAAAGTAVGLPAGQMGNSEVGHLHIGAGRVCWESLQRINQVIHDRQLAVNTALKQSITFCQQHTGRFHFWGLLSDGGVHSNMEHLLALVRIVAQAGIQHIYFHLVADGRDTRPKLFLNYYQRLQALISELGVGQVVTVAGRFYAMDRDKRFNRTDKAYQAMVGRAQTKFHSLTNYVQDCYRGGESDEFLTPGVNSNCADGQVKTDDVVLMFNFRADRAIQLGAVLSNRDYLWQPAAAVPRVFLVTMTDYSPLVKPQAILFPRVVLQNCLGSWLSQHGYRQLRAAETEKIAHVTFFLDGGEDYFANGLAQPQDIKLPGADLLLIPSPAVETYDLQPAMACEALTNGVIAQLQRQVYDLVVLNFANPDMVGHTGVLSATITANQTLDRCLQRLQAVVAANYGLMVVTADHGNAEVMIDPLTQEPNKKHTTNLVPIFVLDRQYRLRSDAKIADIAPTILQLMGVPSPPEMTCRSLIA